MSQNAQVVLTGRKRWLALIFLSLGVAMIILDATVVNVAIPTMIKDLGLTTTDAEWVYAAIGLAHPGGLGQVPSQDVHERPTVTLQEAMALAAERDRIAQQYVNDFELVFDARAKLSELVSREGDWEKVVVALHIWILAHWPDTLIARKCGWDMAERATLLARELQADSGDQPRANPIRLDEFDQWLRADGHRRNPGTTADLIAATLFAALRDGLIEPPSGENIKQMAKSISGCSQEACK
jgi:triphosphoribosyl-dephospho-CoA synthase